PPGDIVPSDYEITAKVTCDQLEKEEEYRITVTKESQTVYYGIAVIVLAVIILFGMIKKYGRR
ncbi:MAG: alpha-galactosidase, partial [Euryarchaeota archaeon]|nr:alpha-galactosidase [Euryarchaeota archaeon]